MNTKPKVLLIGWDTTTTAVMQDEERDLMAVCYGAIDHLCHGFMEHHPPRPPRPTPVAGGAEAMAAAIDPALRNQHSA